MDTTTHTLAKVALPTVQARLGSSSNVTISSPGTSSFDGITANVGDVILLLGQTSGNGAADNGLYYFNGSSSAMTRTSEPLVPNRVVRISEGNTLAHTEWALVTQGAIQVAQSSGNTALTFSPQKTVFNVRDFGAKGDGAMKTDGNTTSVSPGNFQSSTASFTSADVNKAIRVLGGKVGGGDLYTTIQTVYDSQHVTLTTAPQTGLNSRTFMWGTDNGGSTGPFQTALNALAGSGVSLQIPAGNYVFAQPLSLPSQITIEGNPGVVIISLMPFTGGQGNTIFYANYVSSPSSTSLSANNMPGQNTISTAASLSLGTIIRIADLLTSLRVGYYTVTLPGTSPTLDRAVVKQFATSDVVQVMSSQPTDIHLLGHGMRITGTGDRYWECWGGLRCSVRDVVIDQSWGSLANGSIAMSMDLGSRECLFFNVVSNLNGTSDTGLALESAERSAVMNCKIIGANKAAIDFYDCESCAAIDSHGWNSNTGLALQADGNTTGCSDCSVIGGLVQCERHGHSHCRRLVEVSTAECRDSVQHVLRDQHR